MSQISTASNVTPALMQQSTAMRSQREQERANRARESIQASSIASRENIAAQDREATSQNYANLNEARALEAQRDRDYQREKQRLAHEHAAKMVADTRQFALEQELRAGNLSLGQTRARIAGLTSMFNAAHEFDLATRNQEDRARLAANRLRAAGESLIKAQGLDMVLGQRLDEGIRKALFRTGGFQGRDRGMLAFLLGDADTENVGEASEISAYKLMVSQGVSPTEARRKIENTIGNYSFQAGNPDRQEAYRELVAPYLDGLDEIDPFDAAHITQYTGVGESERGFRPITALVGNITGGSMEGEDDLDRVVTRSPEEMMDYTIATVADISAQALGNIEAQDIYEFLTQAINGTVQEGTEERVKSSGHGPALGSILQKLREGLGAQRTLLQGDPEGKSLGLFNIPGAMDVTAEERGRASMMYLGVLDAMYNSAETAMVAFETGEGSLADSFGYFGTGEARELIANIGDIYEAGGGVDELTDHLSRIQDPKIREAITNAIMEGTATRDPLNQMEFFAPAMREEAERDLAVQEEAMRELEKLVEEGQNR